MGSIGDTVIALPCFHAIARAFPCHRRVLLTNALDSVRASSVESVLGGTGLIHDTIYFPLGRDKLRHSLRLARQIGRLNPDALVYLAPRPDRWPILRDLVFFRLLGIRRILGAALAARVRLHRVHPETGELEYEAERMARALDTAIPVDLGPASWDLRLTPEEQEKAARLMARLPNTRPIIAMSPGAKIPAKDWGERNWAALIQRLDRRFPSVSLVLVGAPDEAPLVARLAREWSGTVVDLCGQLTPRESAAVMSRCHMLVCHDSGPMHLAANRGTPCVALFGTYNTPRQWYPYGEGHRVIYEPKGVRAIAVERVMAEIEAVLRPAAQPARTANESSAFASRAPSPVRQRRR